MADNKVIMNTGPMLPGANPKFEQYLELQIENELAAREEKRQRENAYKSLKESQQKEEKQRLIHKAEKQRQCQHYRAEGHNLVSKFYGQFMEDGRFSGQCRLCEMDFLGTKEELMKKIPGNVLMNWGDMADCRQINN